MVGVRHGDRANGTKSKRTQKYSPLKDGISAAESDYQMALTKIKGGPRDGDVIMCACDGECTCTEFGHGAPNGNCIMDGYVLWLMYRKEDGCWVPDHIRKETMICKDLCPRCGRPMPSGTVYCKNCGAEMDVSCEWEN